MYDQHDPDRCSAQIQFGAADATLTELLGASVVTEAVLAVQQQIEGLAIEWITLDAGSPAVGITIGDGQYRTHTGASIVAVLRAGTAVPAPGPEFALQAADVVVAVGTVLGIGALRSLVATG
ncbi:MAG: TrkA C-terminal domain-containing protein [Acidimicrobiales bacterium]